MTLTTDRKRELRGTKRACQACQVRFYDLARSPIVCPACGAENAPDAIPVVPSITAYTPKTGWRRGAKREAPVPVVQSEEAVEARDVEDLTDADAADAAAPAPHEDIVLEPEADETDVSDLVIHEEDEPKDR